MTGRCAECAQVLAAVDRAKRLLEGCGVCGAEGVIDEHRGRVSVSVLHASSCGYALARLDQQQAADRDQSREEARR